MEGEEQEKGEIPNVVLGKGSYLQEFEDAIVGLKEGETKSIDIPPEGGYPSGHKFGDVWMHFGITLVSIDIDVDLRNNSNSVISTSDSTSSFPPPPEITGWTLPVLFVAIVLIALNMNHKKE